MIPRYEYRCRDNSILMDPFKRFIVKPILHFIPRWIPANILSIIANGFLFIALYRALTHSPTDAFDFMFTALCLFLYVLGDHLDGMQAKLTNTSSPLGEFCDHGLDAVNTGILVFLVFQLYDIQAPWIAAVTIASAYLAHASIFFEQYRTGWLIFEQIGSLEGVTLVILVLIAGCISPVRSALTHPMEIGLSPITLMMLSSVLGSMVTWGRILRRLNSVTLRYSIYCGIIILIAVFSALYLDQTRVFLLVTAYGAYYILGLLRSHLVDACEHSPDLLIPLTVIGLSICHIAGLYDTHVFFLLMIIWQGITLFIQSLRIILPLRHLWVWHNPPNSIPS